MEELAQSAANYLANTYPIISTLIFAIGLVRVVNKPIFSILHKLAAETETKRDDEILAVVEESKWYKGLSYVLDWTASIKLPKKVVAVPIETVSEVVKPGVPTVTVEPVVEKADPTK